MSLILSGTDGLSDVDGSAATPAIRGTDANTGIFFPAADTIAFSEGGAEAMRIDSSGNLSIGTTTSSGKFTILDNSGGAGVALITVLTNGVDANCYLSLTGSSATDKRIVIGPSTGTALAFQTNATERMRIDSSGNVQVGTTTRSNDEKLTVYQSGSAMGISVRTTGGPALGNYESADSTRAAYWSFGRDNQTTGNFVFAGNGTLRGSINLSTGIYTASSDSRLKKNITNITYGLNEVMAMRPVTYLMNEEEDTAKKHLGFIAQEVKTLVDEAVDDLIDPDTQFYMLDKGGLVPVLVKAIQEQQALIQSLTARITALETK